MITFKAVTKQYGEDDIALDSLSFDVAPGELVFITGASGSGKTTLMRLLTLETLPSAGEILFEGTALSEIPTKHLHLHRRKIGVVFQDYRLLPELNVWENIALPLFVAGKPESEVAERVTDLLRLVQLTDKALLFPSQLSGGEAQRISIARALASGPEVIFADEPTGNLDPETAHHIAELLIKINELGTTLLFATHDQSFLEKFPKHHRLHLEGGALVIDTARKKASKKSVKKTDETNEGASKTDEASRKEKAEKKKQPAQAKVEIPAKNATSSEAQDKDAPVDTNTPTDTDTSLDTNAPPTTKPNPLSSFFAKLLKKKEKKEES